MYKFGKNLFKGGDGFLLKHNNTYYVYCTTENNLPAFTEEYPFFETYQDGKDVIYVHISKDFENWENGGLCLEKGNKNWGEHGFWAPEVSYYNGKFYMVYTADERIAIAISDYPNGPFEKYSDGFLTQKGAIDGHFFFDDDGTVYLYYCCLEGGNHIKVATLSKDLKKVEKFYDDILIKAEENWETHDCAIAEGPFVLKHNGIYYLTYSANHTCCKDYAVGYATSKNPLSDLLKKPIITRFYTNLTISSEQVITALCPLKIKINIFVYIIVMVVI